MLIVAFCGKAGSGKDTAADYLVRRFRFRKIGFADQLYREVAAGFGVSPDWLQNRKIKETEQSVLALQYCRQPAFVERIRSLYPGIDLETPLSPRRVLQMWGSDWRRWQDPEYFVAHVQERLRWIRRQYPNARVVVSDVRLPNEASMIAGEGGFLFLIERPGNPYVVAPESMAHETERPSQLAPYVEATLRNDGDIKHWHRVIAAAVLPHMRRHRVETSRGGRDVAARLG